MNIFVELLLLAFVVSSQVSRDYESHCVVEPQNSVICRTVKDFDIKQEFEQISGTLPFDGKLFEQLIIYYLPNEVLPENAFFDLQFRQISIHQTYNLTSIHSNAFNSTSNITEHLYLIGTNRLINNPPDYDLYAAISSLTNLKTVTISLSDNQKHEIPENAFRQINGPQNNLEVIEFRGDFIISRIKDDAFSELPNIKRWILLSYIQIKYISEKAFDFSQSSEDRLEIHLNGCGLNESSFADNLFNRSQRPLYLNLDNNNIGLIKESTFANFLTHANNSISFANNCLDCDNRTQFQWLLDQNNELQNRIFNATCSDGILVWDIVSNIECDITLDDATGNYIQCFNDYTPSQLKSEMKRIAQTYTNVSQFGYTNIWYSPLLTELPENVFMGVNFDDTVSFYGCSNIARVHRNAFGNSSNITDLILTNNQLTNSPPEFDLYYAVNTLTNADLIYLALDRASNDHIIPDNAFRVINDAQSKVRTIEIRFNRISRIGKDIISGCDSLTQCLFNGNQIDSIPSDAFNYESSSNTTLEIRFTGLRYIGFEDNMFSGSQRPIQLTFWTDYSRQYIEENIFSVFFSVDIRNQLIFQYVIDFGLNCTDIERFAWILRQMEEFMSRIQNPMCADGTSMWDLVHTDIYWPTNILIVNFEIENIREEFQRISNNQTGDQKHFEMLELYYAPITELQENSFVDISFTEIFLHKLYDLTTINTNAFNGTETSVEILQIIGTKALMNDPTNDDLYTAISSLINLKSLQIELANNIGHEIPVNAFKQINGPQNNLENITFSGDFWITKINDNAFTAIPNLKTIVFSSINIHYISSKAFDFDQSVIKSNDVLEIHLNGCELNESSFDNDVFNNSQRPLYVNLDLNELQLIRESSFGGFLRVNQLNNISLQDNPLNCDDMSEFEWLFSNKTDLENRVVNARCVNGTNLWDLDLSTELPTTIQTTQTSIITSSTAIPPVIMLCNEDFSYNGQYNIAKWPPVRLGETSHSECPPNYVGIATWFCDYNSRFDENGPQINCTQEWIEDLYEIIVNRNITSIDELINYTNEVNEALSDNDLTYYEELNKLTEIIVELQTYANMNLNSSQYFNESQIIAKNIIMTCNNLFSRPKPWQYASNEQRTTITEILILQVQFTSFAYGCQQNDRNSHLFESKNIIVENFKYENNNYFFKSNNSNTAILIPDNIFQPSENLIEFCPIGTSIASIFNNIDQYLVANLNDFEIINSNLIGFSMTNDSNTFTLNNSKVMIRLEHINKLEFGDQTKCAFWDFSVSQWSTYGCRVINKESNLFETRCECNHLTNFVVILDKTNRQTDDNQIKLTLIILCSGMSSICLFMSIIVIKVFKPLRTSSDEFEHISEKITCNLSICLIIANIYILFGMESTNTKWLCQTWSAVLLYALLSAFFWVLLEAFYLYKVTLKIFPSAYRINYLHDIFAYGLPLVLCVIAIPIVWYTEKNYDFDNDYTTYRRNFFDVFYNSGSYFCWISSSQYPENFWIFAYPVIIIMIVNVCLIGLSFRSMYKTAKHVNRRSYALIIGFVFLWFDLVLTWVLFHLYINQFGYYFLYIFIVFNGSQGIFILIFQSIRIAKTVKTLVQTPSGGD